MSGPSMVTQSCRGKQLLLTWVIPSQVNTGVNGQASSLLVRELVLIGRSLWRITAGRVTHIPHTLSTSEETETSSFFLSKRDSDTSEAC